MKLSASQAAKRVGKSIPTITRAIKSGKLSAEKASNGGYEIDPSELFRVWSAISNDTNATPTMLGSETQYEINVLQHEIELLRERVSEKDGIIDDLKTDREEWRKQAQKVMGLVEDNSQRRSLWERLTGK